MDSQQQSNVSVSVAVCSGTACFVTGGHQLLNVLYRLTPEERPRVRLSASPCLDHCTAQAAPVTENGITTPPFVVVDGKTFGGVAPAELVAMIRRRLAAADCPAWDATSSAGPDDASENGRSEAS